MSKQQLFIGISEVPFKKGMIQNATIIGAVVKDSNLECVVSGKVVVDGIDATDEIFKMIAATRRARQIKAIFLKGISVAGFNVIDIERLFDMTKIPIIVYITSPPEISKIEKALIKIGQPEKIEQYRRLDKFFPLETESTHYCTGNNTFDDSPDVYKADKRHIYLQCVGITKDKARSYMHLACRSEGAPTVEFHYPDPIRIVKIIAQGLSEPIDNKFNELTTGRIHKDPIKILSSIIENYNMVHTPNTAEVSSGSNDILVIADWIAKKDKSLAYHIEQQINIINLH